MNDEELLDVYGEDGLETGEVLPKSEIHRHGILHKSAQVWLFDGRGSVLLQKRAQTKKLDPGKWAVPGGHVGTEEESKVAGAREIFEEMGIEKDPEELLYLGTIRHVEHVSENEMIDVYVTYVDIDPQEVMENDEVAGSKYFSIIDLERQYAQENPQFASRPEAFSLIKEYVYGTH
jgi:isopentenyldiphosphate isomerase